MADGEAPEVIVRPPSNAADIIGFIESNWEFFLAVIAILLVIVIVRMKAKPRLGPASPTAATVPIVADAPEGTIDDRLGTIEQELQQIEASLQHPAAPTTLAVPAS